jgi:hypothetical protein
MNWEDYNPLIRAGYTVYAIRELANDLGVMDRGTFNTWLAASGFTAGSTTYYTVKKLYNALQSGYSLSEMPSGSKRLREQEDITPLKKQTINTDITPAKRKSLSNLRGTTQAKKQLLMEVDDENNTQDAPMAFAMASGESAANSMGKETPVTIPPTITYGYQNTHTTILPFTIYAMGSRPSSTTGLTFRYQMNSIYAPVLSTISSGLTTTPPVNGFYNQRYNTVTTTGGAETYSVQNFPDTYAVASTAPAYRTHWDSQFQYYTVLGVEYNITLVNNSDIPDPQGLESGCKQDIEVYKFWSGNTTPPDCNQHTISYWKNVEQYRIQQGTTRNPSSNITTISGVWKPGDVKREVRDDTEAKVWTLTGSAPSLRECLNLRFYPNTFYSTPGIYYFFNMKVTMKYIVQFKQLTTDLQYPTTALWS